MSAHKPENTIAFMGVEGAFADLACRHAQPYMQTMACPSFDDVFTAVAEGRAAMGMLPIENTQAGRVAEIHNILPHTNLHIVGEYFHKVEHQLLGVEGASLETVKDVYSHPQALMQCKGNLNKLKLKTHVHSNTAKAAEDVAKWNDPSKAALASAQAGALYSLKTLKANMEDSDNNYTTFIMIAAEPADPDMDSEKVLTTLIFTIRNIPAALYKAMGGFATNSVNILKLESYIPGGTMQEKAQFFMTIEGHPRQRNVQLALEELGFFTKKVQVLGVYPADPKRFKL